MWCSTCTISQHIEESICICSDFWAFCCLGSRCPESRQAFHADEEDTAATSPGTWRAGTPITMSDLHDFKGNTFDSSATKTRLTSHLGLLIHHELERRDRTYHYWQSGVTGHITKAVGNVLVTLSAFETIGARTVAPKPRRHRRRMRESEACPKGHHGCRFERLVGNRAYDYRVALHRIPRSRCSRFAPSIKTILLSFVSLVGKSPLEY